MAPRDSTARGRRRTAHASDRDIAGTATAMSISEPFIRRPIATSLLMLGVLVFGIGAYKLLPVAPLPNVDFPTITVTASYPGAEPQTMASAIATPLEQQFTSIPALSQMTSLERRRHHHDHAAVRPVAQHRRRGAGRADRDQCRERGVAEGPADPADLPQGQPGRFPDPDLCRPFGRAAGIPARRLCQHRPGGAAVDGAGRRAGLRSSARSPMPRACRSTRRRSPRTASASRTCATRCRGDRQSSRRRDRGRAPGRSRSTPTTSCSTPTAYGNLIVAYQQRRAGPHQGRRRRHQFGAERACRRLVRQPARPRASRSRRPPAPTRSRWSTRSRR